MTTSIPPVSYTTPEYEGFLDDLEKKIQDTLGDAADYLLEYPVVYLHVWQSADDKRNNQYSIYIGEASNIIGRTKKHWADAHTPADKRRPGNWQVHMIEDVDENRQQVVPTLYVFGHQFFNKSFTMDIENQLIDFCLAIPTTHLMNGRGNPQGQYYGDKHFDDVFGRIWRQLKNCNPNLFLSESQIEKSALYKISPNHKLTKGQLEAKQMILEKVSDAVLYQKEHQLIMVEGEAGTGKTVLTSSTFFELLDMKTVQGKEIGAYLLVNHNEQQHTYRTLTARLGHDEDVIENPTSFIRKHHPDEPVDIVFIDEAHLLWTQKKQSYNMGDNQLYDIIDRAKVTVIMFDEFQVMRKEQYLQDTEIRNLRELAMSQNGYIPLNNQLRMHCSPETMAWIDGITKDHVIKPLIQDGIYKIEVFDTPEELQKAIRAKAGMPKTELSRLIATYDWPYSDKNAPEAPEKYWEVKIGDWHLPWNYERGEEEMKRLSRQERLKYRDMAWAEQPHTIGEVGSTFTIQGFDLSYAGVIIGPSVRYDKESGRIRFDESRKAYDKMKGRRTLKDGSIADVSEIFSQHELRVLLSRGADGLYIYACDPALREALKNAVNHA